MNQQGQYPGEPSPPPDPTGQGQYPQPQTDEQLFAELYHGGQHDQEQLDEAERRKADIIKTTNAGISAGAAAGSAAAASVLIGQQAAGAGVAGGGAGVLSTGGAATVVKGGVGLKLALGAAAGVVVVSGVVVGVNVLDRGGSGTPDAAPISQAAMDQGIEKFDFENTTFTDESGNPYEFTDGRYAPPDVPEDRDEGYYLTGTEYADVDGDNDLDAATLIEWRPNAGAVTYTANLWLWDGDKAKQVEYPITTAYQGSMKDLKAVKNGFQITMTEALPMTSTGGPIEPETITFGFKDGYPVQTKPVLGAVDRCPDFEGANLTGPYEGVVPKVAPKDDAPVIGKAEDFKVYTVEAERALGHESWTMVRAEHGDGEIACGWVPLADIQ